MYARTRPWCMAHLLVGCRRGRRHPDERRCIVSEGMRSIRLFTTAPTGLPYGGDGMIRVAALVDVGPETWMWDGIARTSSRKDDESGCPWRGTRSIIPSRNDRHGRRGVREPLELEPGATMGRACTVSSSP